MNTYIQRTIHITILLAGFSLSAQATEVTVYKSASCGCCQEWIKHLQANGFSVSTQNVNDIMIAKTTNGVPLTHASCHTATVNGYVIEGHVPANDIKRLLKERPPVRGLAVPGMPNGSPGMEQGGHPDRYDVLTFDKQGRTQIYSSH